MPLQNLTRKMKWFNNAAYKAGMRSSSGRGKSVSIVLCALQIATVNCWHEGWTTVAEDFAVPAAAKLTGSVVGVSIGCVLGMAPLLFMDTHDQ